MNDELIRVRVVAGAWLSANFRGDAWEFFGDVFTVSSRQIFSVRLNYFQHSNLCNLPTEHAVRHCCHDKSTDIPLAALSPPLVTWVLTCRRLTL